MSKIIYSFDARIGSRNKSGVKSVFRVKWAASWRWRVAIGHSFGKYYITHFACFGQAIKHANEVRAQLHGDFANDGRRCILEVAS